MLAGLVHNTALTVTAYTTSALLNLCLVPFIVRAYGLHDYGLIVLARLLLPTGFMALLDLGVSETGTLVIARARSAQRWDRAPAHITVLFLM